MNVNSLSKTTTIKEWLTSATHQLSIAGISSARLDAEILLADTLCKDRTYLHIHPEQIISTTQRKIADVKLKSRLKRTPIAYIIGHKEFYGRDFIVTPATLIPRPESEDIINILKEILKPYSNSHIPIAKFLVDIGTGTGCLGITAKLEFPYLNVTLTDISPDALSIATLNANTLLADVATLQSDLLQNYPSKVDIIIANLPYVDKNWDRSPETDYEPELALFADNNGRSIIEEFITQASNLLSSGGYIIIEADPVQHDALTEFAIKQSFTPAHQLGYAIAFKYRHSQHC